VSLCKKGGECVDYCARMLSVALTNELPAMLTKLNFCFMSLDILVEKHASSSHIYSLNVVLRHRPIFCICVLLYPARARAFAPPHQSECVSMQAIGIPFTVG
jgi:hypothetical protein